MQEQLAISLQPKRATVTAGGTPAQVVAVIQNQTSVIDSYVLEIAGLDPDWYTLPVTNLALFPGEQKPVNIAFHAPPGQSVLAGSYDYTVRARSMAVTGRVGEATGTLLIVVPEILSMRLKHEIVRGQEGLFELTVTNRSRTPQAVALTARDPEGMLDCTFDPPAPTIPAGGNQAVNLRVRVVPGQVLLAERAFRFNIQAKTTDEREQATPLDAQFVFTPVQVEMELQPARVKGIEGRFNLNVQNPGTNTMPITATLSATDKDGVLDITFQQRRVTLQPRTAVILPVTVRVKAGRKPEIKGYPFTILAHEGDGGATAMQIGQPINGEFQYEPPVAFEVVIEQTGGRAAPGDYRVKINNPSHVGLRLSLRAQDNGNALDLFFANQVDQIPLEAGQAMELPLLARLRFAPPAQQTRYPFQVTAHAVPDDGSAETDQVATAELVAGGAAEPMLRMDLAPERMSGDVGRFQVRLTSTVSTPLQVGLRGQDQGTILQYEFQPARLDLNPGSVELIDLTVRPRDGRNLSPEIVYNFEIIAWVAGMGNDSAVTRPGAWAYIPAGPALAPLALTMNPTYVQGDRGQFELTLVNQGEEPLSVLLRGTDESESLEFVFQEARLEISPMEVRRMTVIVQGQGGGTLNGPYRYPFEIAAWVPGTVQSDASIAYGEIIVTEAPKVPSAWNWQRIGVAALLLVWMILPFILDPIFRGNEQMHGLLQVMYTFLPAVAFPALGALLYQSDPRRLSGWKATVAGLIGFGGVLTYILPAIMLTMVPQPQIFGLALQPFVYLIFLPALLIILFA